MSIELAIIFCSITFFMKSIKDKNRKFLVTAYIYLFFTGSPISWLGRELCRQPRMTSISWALGLQVCLLASFLGIRLRIHRSRGFTDWATFPVTHSYLERRILFLFYVCHMCAWYSQRPEKSVKSHWAGVIVSCSILNKDAGNHTRVLCSRASALNHWAFSQSLLSAFHEAFLSSKGHSNTFYVNAYIAYILLIKKLHKWTCPGITT